MSPPFLGCYWFDPFYTFRRRTCIKSRTSSNFGQIGPQTTELAALEVWNISHRLIMGKWCLHASSFIFDRIIIKIAGNEDRQKSSDEFDFGSLASIADLYIFLMRFDLGTLDSGERSVPFVLLVLLKDYIMYQIINYKLFGRYLNIFSCWHRIVSIIKHFGRWRMSSDIKYDVIIYLARAVHEKRVCLI